MTQFKVTATPSTPTASLIHSSPFMNIIPVWAFPSESGYEAAHGPVKTWGKNRKSCKDCWQVGSNTSSNTPNTDHLSEMLHIPRTQMQQQLPERKKRIQHLQILQSDSISQSCELAKAWGTCQGRTVLLCVFRQGDAFPPLQDSLKHWNLLQKATCYSCFTLTHRFIHQTHIHFQHLKYRIKQHQRGNQTSWSEDYHKWSRSICILTLANGSSA